MLGRYFALLAEVAQGMGDWLRAIAIWGELAIIALTLVMMGLMKLFVRMRTALQVNSLELEHKRRESQLEWDAKYKVTYEAQLKESNEKIVMLTQSITAERASLQRQQDEEYSRREQDRVDNSLLHEHLNSVTDQLLQTMDRLMVRDDAIIRLTIEIENMRLGTARQTKRIESALESVAGVVVAGIEQVKVNTENIELLARESGVFPAVIDPNLGPMTEPKKPASQ